jgi:hypothetical protein
LLSDESNSKDKPQSTEEQFEIALVESTLFDNRASPQQRRKVGAAVPTKAINEQITARNIVPTARTTPDLQSGSLRKCSPSFLPLLMGLDLCLKSANVLFKRLDRMLVGGCLETTIQ